MIGAGLVAAAVRLSPRERWLLTALFGLILPLAVVFLLILPLSDATEAARVELRNAKSLQNWVAARVAEDARLRARQPDQSALPTAAIGISGIEESLNRAGLLSVARLAGGDDGAVELRFEAVEFQVLTAWLTQTTPGWGYLITSFRFDAAGRAGQVNAEFLLSLTR